MELRRHPLMVYRGTPSWPPPWTWVGGYQNQNKTAKDEVGVLDRIGVSAFGASYRCYLWMSYEESTYIGSLLVDDYSFFQQVVSLLQDHCGHSLESIGSLEIS